MKCKLPESIKIQYSRNLHHQSIAHGGIESVMFALVYSTLWAIIKQHGIAFSSSSNQKLSIVSCLLRGNR